MKILYLDCQYFDWGSKPHRSLEIDSHKTCRNDKTSFLASSLVRISSVSVLFPAAAQQQEQLPHLPLDGSLLAQLKPNTFVTDGRAAMARSPQQTSAELPSCKSRPANRFFRPKPYKTCKRSKEPAVPSATAPLKSFSRGAFKDKSFTKIGQHVRQWLSFLLTISIIPMLIFTLITSMKLIEKDTPMPYYHLINLLITLL